MAPGQFPLCRAFLLFRELFFVLRAVSWPSLAIFPPPFSFLSSLWSPLFSFILIPLFFCCFEEYNVRKPPPPLGSSCTHSNVRKPFGFGPSVGPSPPQSLLSPHFSWNPLLRPYKGSRWEFENSKSTFIHLFEKPFPLGPRWPLGLFGSGLLCGFWRIPFSVAEPTGTFSHLDPQTEPPSSPFFPQLPVPAPSVTPLLDLVRQVSGESCEFRSRFSRRALASSSSYHKNPPTVPGSPGFLYPFFSCPFLVFSRRDFFCPVPSV